MMRAYHISPAYIEIDKIKKENRHTDKRVPHKPGTTDAMWML